MTEKSFYPAVQDCMKKNLSACNAVELKLAKGNRFYFKQMEKHQAPWLYAAKHSKVTYKIPDVGFDRKPCDLIMMSNCHAYVGIIYYEPRKTKHLCLIDIDVFLDTEKTGKVSLTEEEATSLAAHHFQL